jgi:hypothetical protein
VEVVRVRRRERRVRVGEGIVSDADECDGRIRGGKEELKFGCRKRESSRICDSVPRPLLFIPSASTPNARRIPRS